MAKHDALLIRSPNAAYRGRHRLTHIWALHDGFRVNIKGGAFPTDSTILSSLEHWR